jgi:hypothetical protein
MSLGFDPRTVQSVKIYYTTGIPKLEEIQDKNIRVFW